MNFNFKSKKVWLIGGGVILGLLALNRLRIINNPEWLYKQGEKALQSQDYARAKQYCTKAAQRNKQYLDAWECQAKALDLLQEYPATLIAYEEILKIVPKNLEAKIKKGEILLKLAEPEKALEEFKQAVKVNENSAQAWRGVGDALKALGDEQAKKDFAAAMENHYKPSFAAYEKAINLDNNYE